MRPDVLFFAPYAGPLVAAQAGIAGAGATGGAETQLFLIAQALRRRGHRVALAVVDVPARLPSVVGGLELVVLPPFGPGGRRFLRFALATALEIDADVIVQRAAGSFTGLVGVPARLRRRRFVYSTASDLDFDPELLSDGILAPRLFRLGVRSANQIVVQTDAQAELCRTRWRRSGHGDPIDRRAGRAASALDPKRFCGSVGSMRTNVPRLSSSWRPGCRRPVSGW